MKHCICSKCLGQADFQESGHDENKKRFDLYFCETCENYTRDFNLTERQTVDEAIAEEKRLALEPRALSANIRQLRMFPAARVTD